MKSTLKLIFIYLINIFIFNSEATTKCNLPKGFVYLKDVAPDIAQQMQYTTSNRFSRKALPGYKNAGDSALENACILSRRVALALARAQRSLKKKHPNLSLMVFDCYRPKAAQEEMKTKIKDRKYVSGSSSHSRGLAFDITIIDTAQSKVLDMGSSFDTFGPEAHYIGDDHNHAVKPISAKNQKLLRRAILGAKTECMKPYSKEWWHFTYVGDEGVCGKKPLIGEFDIMPYKACGSSVPQGSQYLKKSGRF